MKYTLTETARYKVCTFMDYLNNGTQGSSLACGMHDVLYCNVLYCIGRPSDGRVPRFRNCASY